MRKLAIAIAALALVSAEKPPQPVEVPWHEIGSKFTIIGQLGRPIGELVTIQGRTVESPKGPQVLFFVAAVDGKPLKPGTTIHVDGIAHWPVDSEARLRGRDVGRITILEPHMTGVSPAEASRLKPRQVVYSSFEVDEVLQPKSLTLEDEPVESR